MRNFYTFICIGSNIVVNRCSFRISAKLLPYWLYIEDNKAPMLLYKLGKKSSVRLNTILNNIIKNISKNALLAWIKCTFIHTLYSSWIEESVVQMRIMRKSVLFFKHIFYVTINEHILRIRFLHSVYIWIAKQNHNKHIYGSKNQRNYVNITKIHLVIKQNKRDVLK